MSSFDETGFIDISGDGGLLKKILGEGEGAFPPSGYEVEAHYTGTLDDGSVFDSSRDRNKTFKFTLGKGQVIKGWDNGFASMKKGEKAILRCRSDYAYGKNGQGKIPPNATLNFDVELIDFKPKKKEKWEYSDEEKLSEATRLKESGNRFFSEKNFSKALEDYEEGAELSESGLPLQALYIALKLNAAQAAINLGKFPDAVDSATEVIKRDPKNVKALYRRGVARNHLGLAEEALGDLEQAVILDPENKAAKTESLKSKKLIADAKKKEKAIYGNMFSKVSVYDDKELPVIPGSSLNNPKVMTISNYLIFPFTYLFVGFL